MRRKGAVTSDFDPARPDRGASLDARGDSPARPTPLTRKQKAELEALAALPDEAIDTSDIPPLSEEFWQIAERGKFYRPVKQQLTLRLDADVVAWFKSHARDDRGYQTNINRALREHVLRQEKKAG